MWRKKKSLSFLPPWEFQTPLSLGTPRFPINLPRKWLSQVQRIARRDKKAFLNEQYQEIEENSRMGKTRDLFKKIGDIKGTFHARMGMTKNRTNKDRTEAEEIKKRWHEYTEDLYKKWLNDVDNHDLTSMYLKYKMGYDHPLHKMVFSEVIWHIEHLQ